ncbi:MAG: hypothetical protein QXG39_05260 [Candidatus Aenigmatarchaeota archaeon]
MKLKKIGVKYIDVGILLLPYPVYQDEKGNYYLYDAHWEKRKKGKKGKDEEELEKLLKIDRWMKRIIEGEIFFEDEKYIGIEDKENKYWFKKLPS